MFLEILTKFKKKICIVYQMIYLSAEKKLDCKICSSIFSQRVNCKNEDNCNNIFAFHSNCVKCEILFCAPTKKDKDIFQSTVS